MSRDVQNSTEFITREVVDLLNVILDSEHSQDFDYVFENFGKIWFSTESGHYFGLDENKTNKYAEIIDNILNLKPWKNRLSFKYAQNKINNLLRDSLSDAVEADNFGALPKALIEADFDDIRERIRSLVVDFDREASQEWIVYLPIAGIEAISGNSLKIGRACLKYMNSVEMEVLRGKVDKILLTPSAPSDKAKEANVSIIWKQAEKLNKTVCALYQITAESERAKEIAEEQTQDVLDLLSYFISFIHSRDYKGAVRLQGEMASGHRTTLLLTSNADRLYQANQRTGA